MNDSHRVFFYIIITVIKTIKTIKYKKQENTKKFNTNTMKTNLKSIMKIFTLVFIIMSITSIDVWASKQTKNDDNKEYYEISGKIIDKNTQKVLAFASISVEGENTATISNPDGEFILKIAKTSKAKNIIISYLGYDNLNYAISNFGDRMHVVQMNPTFITLSEVVISPKTPDQLVQMAFNKVSENFANQAFMMTGFFREYIKKRKNYVSLAEAVVEIYKSDYVNQSSMDNVKILKGRKGTDKRKLDTLLFKIQGGPATILLLDIAKNPEIVFSEENFRNYKFTMEPQVKIANRINYVVNFEQVYRSDNPMYKGKLFIDTENHAITGAEFELNILDKVEAGQLFLRKKPAGVNLLLNRAVYKVMYKEQNKKWHFSYANGYSNYDIKWKKKLFTTNYSTMIEIAITDRYLEGVEKIKSKDRFKRTDFFDEKVSDFYDNDFWGSYNTIKPDDPIESAIKRLKRINR